MNRHIHFIGIGGIGMSGIASIFLRKGDIVSGSDIKENQNIQRLKALGAHIYIGHSGQNIENPDTVVYSSAISQDNPEIIQAKKKNIPVLKRAQALAELMQDKIGIAITGAHGKTTTTSLISHLLINAGLCPTIAIGGILRNLSDNACLGDSRYFVAEADESDGSFLYYYPTYSVITNIDREHLDYYGNLDNIISSCREFMSKTREDGLIFACGDDPRIKNILKDFRKSRYLLFGLGSSNDYCPKNIKLNKFSSEFDCYFRDGLIGHIELNLAGMHNVSNSLACIGIGRKLGVSFDDIKESLSNYQGSERRFQVKLKNDSFIVIDDYAHHPTEIRATLAAARNAHQGRIIAVFQPHRYSRVKFLLDEFEKSFDLVDYLVLTDIYAANEKPIEGVNSRVLFDRIKKNRGSSETVFLSKENIIGHLSEIAKPGDMIVTLGAGDINKICDELTKNLQMVHI